MKRLLMLTVVATVTVVAVGCGWCDRMRRGPNCDTCPSAGPYAPVQVNSGAAGETYLPAPG